MAATYSVSYFIHCYDVSLLQVSMSIFENILTHYNYIYTRCFDSEGIFTPLANFVFYWAGRLQIDYVEKK